jgi:3-oxoacyl-[acyl-carrier-protein] synthase-1
MALSITGVGMVTSLGFGVSGSCGGIRAGLSMPRLLQAEASDGEGQVSQVVGFPVPQIANGLVQAGAWVQLAKSAVEDLRHSAELPGDDDLGFWQRAKILGALPHLDPDRFGWGLQDLPEGPQNSFLHPLLGLAFPRDTNAGQWMALGHASTAALFMGARNELATRGTDRCLIVAADSYVDPLTLDWLARAARLKSGESPSGLMPGEAGGALLLETDEAARRRKAAVLGTLEAMALDSVAPPPPDPEDEDAPPPMPPAAPLGRAIAEAISKVLPGVPFTGDLYLDLNGEDWRAAAWGHAQVHLSKRIDWSSCRTFAPAESLGETGAASGALAVGLALFNFDADDTQDALVVSVAENGTVSALRLRAPRP